MTEVISDLEARQIAADWHGGQASAMYSFVSTGAISPDLVGEIKREIENCQKNGDTTEQNRLSQLLTHVNVHGGSDPVESWSDLTW